MIRFTCACGEELQAPEESAGDRTTCPKCGCDVLIPDAAAAISVATVGASDEEEDALDADHELGPPKTSGKATASLILGIASFVCLILTCIAAILFLSPKEPGLFVLESFVIASLVCVIVTGISALILGIMSLVQIKRSHGQIRGQGRAISGIVGSLLPVILLLAAVQKVPEAAGRMTCTNKLKQLAFAMHNYHDVHGRFPPAAVYSKDGKPLYSWRVLLLPYLELNALYQQFKLDEPWDSPHNQRLLANMPHEFSDPSAPTKKQATTFYQVFVGPGTAFESPQGERLKDFPDGPSNTFLIVEAAQAVPWTKPADLSYDPNQQLPKLGGQHTDGFFAAMADGRVLFIPQRTTEQVLRALITRNGGELLPPDF